MRTNEDRAFEAATKLAEQIHGATVRNEDFYLEDITVEIPGNTGFHVSIGCDVGAPYFSVVEEVENGCLSFTMTKSIDEVLEALPGVWV